MYKKILPIIIIAPIVLAVIGWQTSTQSKTSLPYPKLSATSSTPLACVQATANEIYLMKKAHNQHFQSVIEQEKATSAVVGEAYESLRTYRCWLDYLCEAVLYSGTADQKQMSKDAGNNVSLGVYLNTVPGCVAGEYIEIPTTKIKYMPNCHVGAPENKTYADVGENYRKCKDLVRMQFEDPTEEELENKNLPTEVMDRIKQASAGMVSIETALKKKSAKQKGNILSDKLSSIVLKMHSMESHTTQLYEYIEKLDQRIPCYIGKCD